MNQKLKYALAELALGNQSDRKALARLEKVGDFSVDEALSELDRLEEFEAIAKDALSSPRKFSPLRATATVIAAGCTVGSMALLVRPEHIPVAVALGSGVGFGVAMLREE